MLFEAQAQQLLPSGLTSSARIGLVCRLLFLVNKGLSARAALCGPVERSGSGSPPEQWPSSRAHGGKVWGGAGMKMINVVLVGTNNLFRQGLRRLLDPSQFL